MSYQILPGLRSDTVDAGVAPPIASWSAARLTPTVTRNCPSALAVSAVRSCHTTRVAMLDRSSAPIRHRRRIAVTSVYLRSAQSLPESRLAVVKEDPLAMRTTETISGTLAADPLPLELQWIAVHLACRGWI